MSPLSRLLQAGFVLLLSGFTVLPVHAQSEDQQGISSQNGVVTYDATFFSRYQIKTALEMVNRVPGFTLDDGGDKRGFGGAAGNVLINNRRPSTKQDLPSAILGRISADQVEKIELIRVRIRDIDLQGHVEVVNVLLNADADAAVRWELYDRFNLDHGHAPYASISLSDRLGEIEYNVGVDTRWSNYGDPGTIRTFDADGNLTEIRHDSDNGAGQDYNAYLNAAAWLGKNFVTLNSRINSENRDILQVASRYPQNGGSPRTELIETLRRNKRFSLGLDAERVLAEDFLGKGIFVYSLLDQEPSVSQESLNSSMTRTRFQLEDEETANHELIARLEFDYAGVEHHAIQADLEWALNILDNTQVFTDDTGAGPVVVEVPGANVRVEEDRWNARLLDTWSRGTLDLEYGLGYERSTIAQTGDSNLERSFSFIKPRAVLTWSPHRGNQTRLLFDREIAQLDFNDFVSATVFEDDDVALGNPDLRPDSTWLLELSHERRFADVGVIKLTLFHHWIDDVLDLLPLTPTFEAPGNIGNGRRWGVKLETTLPLDILGLDHAQLEVNTRLQDSTVVDPVTGLNRHLSGEGGFRGDVGFLNENRYAYEVNFRQDLQAARVSWGVGIAERDERVLYKANELDIFNEGYNLTAFVETSRWFGVKILLEGQNLLNTTVTRDRTIYVTERSLTPVLRREVREGTNGARLFLRFSGTF